MAKGQKERGMLFDIRGRRRNVIKVVYAVLALLMGASLILLYGPGFGGGGGSSGTDLVEQYEDQAKRVERKLVNEPENSDLLLRLARLHVSAGNALSESNPTTGEVVLTAEGRQQLEKASEAWSEYLEATDEPSASAAQLVAPALFSLAQSSRTTLEALGNITAASEAQAILAEQRPSIGTLSTYALYTLYTADYAAAERALQEAKKMAGSKFERQQLQQQFDQIKKIAKEFERQVAALEKAAKEGAQNPESVENPLGLGGGLAE